MVDYGNRTTLPRSDALHSALGGLARCHERKRVTKFPDIAACAKALAARDISARELAAWSAHALAQVDTALDCVVEVDRELAERMAAAADTTLAGGDTSALLGVPMAHKDMFYRPGRPTEAGSKILKDFRPDHLATNLARLDAAGSVDLGRLHMAEFAFGSTGHNAMTATPKNPWDPLRITGGSSSGSAAAVSSGAVFAALGSDTGGSIRNPAACCGLVGLKPSFGRTSNYGALPASASMDCTGALVRSVRDAAILLQVLAGYDPNDAGSSTVPVEDYVAALDAPLEKGVLGVPGAAVWAELDPQIAGALEAAAKVYTGMGFELRELDLGDVELTNSVARTLSSAEGAAFHKAWLDDRAHDYGAQTRARLEFGLSVTATDYIEALRLRVSMLERLMDNGLRDVDALLLPAFAVPVPTIAETDVAASPGFDTFLREFSRFYRAANVMGLPALAIPVGFDTNGMPIGAQLMGQPYTEVRLLQLAYAFERETGYTSRIPTISAAPPF